MSDDITRLIGAVKREVRNEIYQGKAAKVVVASRVYDTGIDDLWDAISNPERLPRWFMAVEGDLRLGGRYQLKGNAGGAITRCEPPRELAMTWEFGGGVSWVEISLRPEGEGTHLQLRHIAHPEAHWEQFGPGAVGVGWELGLRGLAKHVADPATALSHEDEEAWSISPEGKIMIRDSAEGWGKADVAAGEVPDDAMERAERTRRFYSGEA